MNLYDRFARFYHEGPYRQFSLRVASVTFPHILDEIKLKPDKLLDLACGEGSFAIEMAKQGMHVTGLDCSKAMLDIARSNARDANVNIEWVLNDMQQMQFNQQFDAVTCFFDSLNYLLSVKDLHNTFHGAYNALTPGGYFIFDMNTLYGLEVEWQRFPDHIQQDQPSFMEIHTNSCDYENDIATVRIIIFEKQANSWQRYEEIHQERGYSCEDTLFLLKTCGFEVMHLLGDPQTFRPLGSQDGRLWVIARRSGS
jgi:ubiquinone/menaquinone biosynthesis C-methylase UbiE